MIKLKLSGKNGKDKFAIIDDCNSGLTRYRWWLSKIGYPVTDIWNKESKKSIRLYLHRLIIDPGPDLVVDHIDGNKLDNRLINLRTCTREQNQRNRVKLNKNNTSGFRGVTWDNKEKVWVAQISLKRKHIHLGQSKDLNKARELVKMAILENHGEFSNLKYV